MFDNAVTRASEQVYQIVFFFVIVMILRRCLYWIVGLKQLLFCVESILIALTIYIINEYFETASVQILFRRVLQTIQSRIDLLF
jgi:hypothetical protein